MHNIVQKYWLDQRMILIFIPFPHFQQDCSYVNNFRIIYFAIALFVALIISIYLGIQLYRYRKALGSPSICQKVETQ
jgi:hypothetical protein